METNQLLEIKKLALISMFTDDNLVDIMVLKGGNVLDLVYDVAFRSSVDLDFSIEREFDVEQFNVIKGKIRKSLQDTFRTGGYHVFDVCCTERPRCITADMKDFWGGYRIEFKVIEESQYRLFADHPRNLRTHAHQLGPGHRKAFKIDISKFEYCKPKQAREIEGCTVYVYTPEMLVFEKLRAICQQMPEYLKEVNNPSQSARARDFFDIFTILENFKAIEFTNEENSKLLKNIFLAKRVPLKLIGCIPKYREFHRQDFSSVENTAKPTTPLKTFDFYFDYVVENCCKVLKPLWEE